MVEWYHRLTLFTINFKTLKNPGPSGAGQKGETDYQKRTANLAMHISLAPSKAGFDALNALLEGLEKTGRRNTWGFEGWPLQDLRPAVSGTKVLSGGNTASFTVEVLLLNERKKQIGRGSIILSTEMQRFTTGDTGVTPPTAQVDVIRFQNIKADDLTPALTIVINSVNRIPSRTLNATGYMRIVPFDSSDPVAYFNRGNAYLDKLDYDRAIADYEAALRIDPNYVIARNALRPTDIFMEQADAKPGEWCQAPNLEKTASV